MTEYIERQAIMDALLYEQYGYLCEDAIACIPAADVQPVRHGRWKHEENWETGFGVWVNVCSACGAITPVNVSRYKFCPNCGAKMDGGDT